MSDAIIEVYSLEMKLIQAIKDMEDYGCKVDLEFLKDLQVKLNEEINGILAQSKEIDPFLNIGSPLQLVQWLLAHGIKVPEKVQVKDEDEDPEDREIDSFIGKIEKDVIKDPRYSVDSKVLKKIDHPVARLVERYRKALKFKSTYVDALLDSHIEGVIHPDFRTIQARTGRLSCSRPSLQTIPKDSEDATEEQKREAVSIRKAFIPREGCRLFPMDYSQQEIRLFAHYTNDATVMKLLSSTDFHKSVAALINGIPEETVTKSQRTQAKSCTFGILYAMGVEKLAKTLDCSEAEAKKIMKSYFDNLKGAKHLIEHTKQTAFNRGYVKTLFGRPRYLHYTDRSGKEINETHKALNTIIQGSAADIMKIMLVKINKFLKYKEGVDWEYPYGVRCILTIHDEIILEVPYGQEGIVPLIKDALEYLPMVRVPMVADVSVCENNWSEKKKVTEEELSAWRGKPVKLLKHTHKDPYSIIPITLPNFQPTTGLFQNLQ